MTKKSLPLKPDATTHRLDATNIPLGRLSTNAANLLRGKDRPDFAPHIDGGHSVVIVNAKNVALTGRKLEQKVYQRHTGWLGNLKTKTAAQMMIEQPDEIVRRAIYGMLPKNRLRKLWLKRLTIWPGEEGAEHGR